MRGEFHQVVNPRQDMGITTTKSETLSLGKKATTEPTTNIKLKGGAEVSVFEKEGKYTNADLCVERRKAGGAAILKRQQEITSLSVSSVCSGGLVQSDTASVKVLSQKSGGSCFLQEPYVHFCVCCGRGHSKWHVILRTVATLTCKKRSLCVCIFQSSQEIFYIYIQSHNQTRD